MIQLESWSSVETFFAMINQMDRMYNSFTRQFQIEIMQWFVKKVWYLSEFLVDLLSLTQACRETLLSKMSDRFPAFHSMRGSVTDVLSIFPSLSLSARTTKRPCTKQKVRHDFPISIRSLSENHSNRNQLSASTSNWRPTLPTSQKAN